MGGVTFYHTIRFNQGLKQTESRDYSTTVK